MTHVISDEFTNKTGLRKAQKRAREIAAEMVTGSASQRVRFKSNCYLLQTNFGNGWVNHVTGLTAAEDKVGQYEGTDHAHRLVIRWN